MLKFLYYILGIIFLYNIFCVLGNEDSKLVFVQILWRHGDRAPIDLYPNDPNPESVWNEGLGKLTMLGRKQHYALGKYFRQMYENFATWSPNEINVTSSECDRCMKSAETNLASFFAPSPEWKFDQHLNWQPIPIYYIPKPQDKYLETDSDCPRAVVEQKRIVNSPEGQAFISKHQEMFGNLTIDSGSPITNWTSASYLHDVLFIEKKYNLSIPHWADYYWDELTNVSDLSFFWSYNSQLLHRLRAGPLLQRTIEMMKRKLSGDIPLQKFQIYSAHDSNIAVVLNALNLFNMKQPPYCASLVFELHERADGINLVRLLYLNSTRPEMEPQEPHILVLDGCTEFCQLDYFINITKSLIPDDWKKECQLDRTFLEKLEDKNITVGLFFALMAGIILTLSMYSLWKVYNRDRDKYSYHLMSMD